MAEYKESEPIETGIEITNGPIWTLAILSSYNGNREASPEVHQGDVQKFQSMVWDMVRVHKHQMDFAGDIQEHDVFVLKESDILVEAYIRIPEDMVSVKTLWDFTEALQKTVKSGFKDPFSLRRVDIVSESYVEQQYPELV